MSEPILVCKNVNKSYKSGVPVLEGFNCTLEGGRIIGLLGPNGCGKSTLMKLICGLLVPDSGEISVCGETEREKINALVSYLPERSYFNSGMKVCELVEFFADFYSDFDVEVAYRMLSDLGIDRDAKLKILSKGTKEKVQLIMVMARKARLYLLDEPIAGVDPAARDYIMQTIIGNYNPSSTVVITTHLIHDVEPILDEFAFLGFKGQIALSGNADAVRAEHGKSLNELFREVFRCYGNY